MDVTGLGFMRGETPFEEEPPLMLDFGITPFNNIKRRAVCGSGDNFVEDKTQYYGEVVDMEAYVYAKFSQKFNIDFACYKFVSDYADENSLKNWSKELLVGAELFKKKLLLRNKL